MAKNGPEEGPLPKEGYFTPPAEKPFNINDTQPTRTISPETVEQEPTPEPEPQPTTKINIIANILWFFFFVGLLWLSDLAGEAFPTPLDDIIYDTAIAIFYGILASLGVFTKRK